MEARRLPPGRFEGLTLLYEPFEYSDGPLLGNSPPVGPTWTVQPGGTQVLSVVNHSVSCNPGDTDAASALGVMSAPQFAAAWWLEFKVIPGPDPVNQCFLGFTVGNSDTGGAVGCLFNYGGLGTPGSFEATAGNIDAPEIDIVLPAGDPAAEHVVRLLVDPVGGDLHLLYDDVVVGSATGFVAGGSNDRSATIFLDVPPVTPRQVITELDIGAGVF